MNQGSRQHGDGNQARGGRLHRGFVHDDEAWVTSYSRSTGTTTPVQTDANACGAKGNIALSGCGEFHPFSGKPARTSAFHHQRGNQAKWWRSRLAGKSGRPARLGSGMPSEVMQARQKSGVRPGRGEQTLAAVVARTDCRLAQALMRGQLGLSSVARDNLPEPLYTGPWCTKEGTAGAPAPHAGDASPTSLHDEDGRPRKDLRHSTDQRATSHSRRLRDTRSLRGHLQCSRGRSLIVTLVERQTRYLMPVETAGKLRLIYRG